MAPKDKGLRFRGEKLNGTIGIITEDHLRTNLIAAQQQVVQSAGKNAASRKAAHDQRLTTSMVWEDFLYYQNPIHRWGRIRRKRGQKGPRLWTLEGYILANFLTSMLDHFDLYEIGGSEYRQGKRYVTGRGMRRIRRNKHERHLVGPEELHLWTPAARREPVGLSRRRGLRTLCPLLLELDEEAIEARRAEIENQPLTAARTGETLAYRTHSERRQAEIASCWDAENQRASHPTSNLRRNAQGVLEHSFSQIRTESGLFIAAKETSSDWLTSYDCLGRVAARTVAVKLETSHGKKSTNEVPETKVPSKSGPSLIVKLKTNGKGKVDKNESRSTRKARGKKRGKVQEDDYGYEYDDFEFTAPPKEHPLWEPRLKRKTWCEATEGRREWHIARRVLDSSPPTSPPCAPLRKRIHMSTIPEGISSSELPPPQHSICPHSSPKCRAWWPHEPRECWEAHIEPTRANGTALGDPLIIPQSGREIYRDRLEDHYARLQTVGEKTWPEFGVIVPYSPTTVHIEQGAVQRQNVDAEGFDISAICSMAVPLFPTTLSQGAWTRRDPDEDASDRDQGDDGGDDVDVDDADGDEEDSGDESDDEHDLFRNAYLEAAQAPDSSPDESPRGTGVGGEAERGVVGSEMEVEVGVEVDAEARGDAHEDMEDSIDNNSLFADDGLE